MYIKTPGAEIFVVAAEGGQQKEAKSRRGLSTGTNLKQCGLRLDPVLVFGGETEVGDVRGGRMVVEDDGGRRVRQLRDPPFVAEPGRLLA